VAFLCALAFCSCTKAPPPQNKMKIQMNELFEAEWLSSPDRGWVSLYENEKIHRKLGLWACACLRRIWSMLTDESCRFAVEVTEKNIDRYVTEEQNMSAYHDAIEGWGAQAA
jgi:hypothetical protein